jgi:hypothetical protein
MTPGKQHKRAKHTKSNFWIWNFCAETIYITN